jgi:hypothetical protein
VKVHPVKSAVCVCWWVGVGVVEGWCGCWRWLERGEGREREGGGGGAPDGACFHPSVRPSTATYISNPPTSPASNVSSKHHQKQNKHARTIARNNEHGAAHGVHLPKEDTRTRDIKVRVGHRERPGLHEEVAAQPVVICGGLCGWVVSVGLGGLSVDKCKKVCVRESQQLPCYFLPPHQLTNQQRHHHTHPSIKYAHSNRRLRRGGEEELCDQHGVDREEAAGDNSRAPCSDVDTPAADFVVIPDGLVGGGWFEKGGGAIEKASLTYMCGYIHVFPISPLPQKTPKQTKKRTVG